jgi:hypothetical protein
VLLLVQCYVSEKKSKYKVALWQLNNFKMIEAMGIKIKNQCPLEWHYSVPNFTKIYQAVQNLLVGYTQTDR